MSVSYHEGVGGRGREEDKECLSIGSSRPGPAFALSGNAPRSCWKHLRTAWCFRGPGCLGVCLRRGVQASWRGGRTRPQLTLVAGSLLATWPGDHEASTALTWRLGARRHHLVTVTAGDRWSHQSPRIWKCPSLTASPFQLHDSARRPALGARGSRAQASHVLHGDNRRPAAGDSDLPRTAFYPVPAGASATSRPRTPAGASLGASRDVQGLCHHRHVLRRLHGGASKPPFPAQTLGRGRCTLKQELGFLA